MAVRHIGVGSTAEKELDALLFHLILGLDGVDNCESQRSVVVDICDFNSCSDLLPPLCRRLVYLIDKHL